MKSVWGFVSLIIFMLVVSACGNKSGDSGKSNTVSPKEATNKSAKPAETKADTNNNSKNKSQEPQTPQASPPEKVISTSDAGSDDEEPKITSGACTKAGMKINPCLKCPSKLEPPEAKSLSEKAILLAEIMEKACTYTHLSYPKGYKPPTRKSILELLVLANEKTYNSDLNAKNINAFVDELISNESKTLFRLFSGYSYQPPFSELFETYFGIDIDEARSLFCLQNGGTQSFNDKSFVPLKSKKLIDCETQGGFGCTEVPEYNNANLLRLKLRDVYFSGLKANYSKIQDKPEFTRCRWQKLEGRFKPSVEVTLTEWISLHQVVYGIRKEKNARCEKIVNLDHHLKGQVSLAVLICED